MPVLSSVKAKESCHAQLLKMVAPALLVITRTEAASNMHPLKVTPALLPQM